MPPATTIPEPGQLVRVRHRHFVVLDVQKSALPPDAMSGEDARPQHLVSLSSVEDDALGEELRAVWELEPGAAIHEHAGLPEPTGFDDPARLDAFLDAVRWGAVSSADDRSLQAPFRAGIEIEEYQLDPVVRALRMPRVNLLVADDVGLGKTIEAGLVAQELILRHRVRSILVVCPSSIQIQWRNQMRDKFGLEFRIVDSDLMKDLRRRRGIHVNPWTHFPRLITSIDFLKRERPLRLFRDTLPAGDEPTYPRRYDLLIVDEAHNVAPSGRGRYATDSLRTLAVRTLVPHFEHKLFLTATPHNGYTESFSALLALVDNQRFAPGIMKINQRQLETIMVRRMKEELELKWDGSRRFAKRVVGYLEVEYTEAERHAHRALKEYTELRLKNASSQTEAFASEFVLKLLKKRLFSSPEAFAITLAKHEASLRAAGKSPVSDAVLRRQVEDIEEEFADDDQYEEATLEAVDAASRTSAVLGDQETVLLRELREYARDAPLRPDSKAKRLIDWLRQTLKPDGEWNNERVLIFTEYRATQKWLHGLLAAAGFAQGERLLTLYGGMDPEERERVKAAFQHDPKESSVRILLATDCASEGIDLQRNCHRLIHLEVPWNPARLEQRNGRLDRFGQPPNNEVLIHHFVGKGFDARASASRVGDLEGDLEFLMRAVLKVETIRQDLGKVGPVIALQVEEAMLGRRRALETQQAERDAEPVRKLLKFERDLRKQLEKLHEQLFETKRELRLSPENIQKVVEIGLALADQPQLLPVKVPGVWPDPTRHRTACPVFRLPAFKGSWALCADGLAHPHTGEIRPITFDPAISAGRDDIVLAHLNHRLVQMCLRLLRAEVWSQGTHRKLHRVTARLVPSHALKEPAVIAHGRLVVLGGDNQRLHEEIIVAGGYLREGRFARMNVGESKAALDAGLPEEAPDAVKESFKVLWPTLEKPLLQALEARMTDRTKGLQKGLDERCDQEVANITAILQELQQTIREQLDEPVTQLEFWTSPEREQLELNMQSIRHRLAQIPGEIERETEHLRSRYRNPTPRLFPVTVTFLVPTTVAAETGGRA
jgi:superfamily II DNA or RNA helicase